MPLLVSDAALLSQNDLVRGVIEEIIDVDELFALFPFTKTDGKAYVYNRENTITEADFLSPYDVVNEGGASFTQVTSTLKIMAGDVDLDKFTLETQSDSNNQLAIQLAAKAKGMGRAFRRALVNGSSAANAKSFDGIASVMPASQTILVGANGGALTLGLLDELKDMVKLGADCFMMNRATWRLVRSLLRAFNGNDGFTMMIPNFGKPVPYYGGVPVILTDFVSNAETVGSNQATTSIYALRLNEADGFHGIWGGASAGMRVEEIGTIQNKDAVRYRVKWYVGTALKSTHSVARLAGVNAGA